MKYKAVIFDLDGTLLDTLEDLADAVNAALKSQNMPRRTLPEVRAFVGNGVRKLMERAVPPNTPAEALEAAFQAFLTHYMAHSRDKTKPYPGIPELLKTLRERGVKLALVSNKADPAVQELGAHYFPNLLDFALGEKEGIPRKPEPQMVWAALEKLGVDKKDAVYVGDSEVDVQTAQNSGLTGIFVTWGFRDKEVLKAHSAQVFAATPQELLDLLTGASL